MIPHSGVTVGHRGTTYEDIAKLAPRILDSDLEECLLFGHEAHEALLIGNASGMTLSATSRTRPADDNVIGIFGCTYERILWSLWRHELTLKEQLSIIRLLPEYVRYFQKEYSGTLHNWILKDNTRALRWLEASRLFTFGPEVTVHGRTMVHFQTKELS